MKTSLIFLLTTPALFAGDYAPLDTSSISPPASRGWTLSSFSAGSAWRTFGGLSYQGRSRSQNFMIPSVVGGNSISLPAIGSESNLFDREYDDGYVRQDDLTSGSGDTWYWGYDSPSQLQGDQLVFHATGFESKFSETRNLGLAGEYDRDLSGLSPQIDLIFSPPPALNLPFKGLLFSFWHFNASESSSFSNFQLNQRRDDFQLNFTDRFNLGGVVPPLAPYTGSQIGPGALIPNAPGTGNRSETTNLISSETASFSNFIKTDLDLDAFSLAIGPTLNGNFKQSWGWRTSFGVSLNYYQWKASETETLSLSRNGTSPTVFANWRESSSDSKFRLGLFAKGEIVKSLQNDWFVAASAQLDLVDDFEIDLGGSSYKVSPSGFSLGLSVGKSF